MYRLVVDSLQPYPLLFLLTWVGLAVVWRKHKEQRRRLAAVLVPFALLTLFSLPVGGYFGLGSLEWPYPPSLERPEGVEAIVVLSAGVMQPDARRLEPEMDLDTLKRCLHAARLYRQGPPCLVFVSGGKVLDDEPGPSYAEVMAPFLEQLGVRPEHLVLETRSRTTYENARETHALLKARQIGKIALVVDASSMYRAERCFRKLGVEVAPAACSHRATEFAWSVWSFLPHPATAHTWGRVGHEWLGSAWYWLHDRI